MQIVIELPPFLAKRFIFSYACLVPGRTLFCRLRSLLKYGRRPGHFPSLVYYSSLFLAIHLSTQDPLKMPFVYVDEDSIPKEACIEFLALLLSNGSLTNDDRFRIALKVIHDLDGVRLLWSLLKNPSPRVR